MRTTRRSAVAASGALALGLAACTQDEPGGSLGSPTPPPPAGSSTGAEPRADPDLAALERAATLTIALLTALARAGPRVDPTGELRRLHAEHLSALQEVSGATASPTSPGPSPGGRRVTARQLAAKEVQAERELAALAEDAESGPVARLLASMSAGLAAALARRGEVPS